MAIVDSSPSSLSFDRLFWGHKLRLKTWFGHILLTFRYLSLFWPATTSTSSAEHHAAANDGLQNNSLTVKAFGEIDQSLLMCTFQIQCTNFDENRLKHLPTEISMRRRKASSKNDSWNIHIIVILIRFLKATGMTNVKVLCLAFFSCVAMMFLMNL